MEQPSNTAQSKPNSGYRKLIVGIKRRLNRNRDAKSSEAEAALRANRKGALERANYRCVFCGARSLKWSEVYHFDDNHHNNSDDNLGCVCKLCHPYNHIGEFTRNGKSSGLEEGHLTPTSTLLIRVPNEESIPARDFNHLLRAIAIGLSDKDESDAAKKVYSLLIAPELRLEMVKAFLGDKADESVKSLNPKDLAGAMGLLTDDEFTNREATLGAVRVLYNHNLLAQWGRGWKAEQPAFAEPSGWARLLERQMSLITPAVAVAAASDAAAVSVDFDDSDDEDEDNDD